MLGLAGYLAGAAVATKYPGRAVRARCRLAGWVRWRSKYRGRVDGPCAVRGTPRLRRAIPARSRGRVAWRVPAGRGGRLRAVVRQELGPDAAIPPIRCSTKSSTARRGRAEKERQWNRVHRPHDFSAETLGNDLGRVVLTSEWLSPLVVPLARALAFWLPALRREQCVEAAA